MVGPAACCARAPPCRRSARAAHVVSAAPPRTPRAPPPHHQALVAALAALYAASFASVVLQGPSLFGSGGLVPIEAHLKQLAEESVGDPDYTRWGVC